MKHIFKKHEIQFILWTSGVFLISVIVLVALGLVPSEFKISGGETFEQKTRIAVREILEGKSSTLITGQNTNAIVNSNSNSNSIVNQKGYNDVYLSENKRRDMNESTNIGSHNSQSVSNQQIKSNSKDQSNLSINSNLKIETPIRIVIPSISVDTIILNPKSTSFEVLDSALTTGAVRYPGSGYPGLGNMFVFGHSTGFSVVQNPAYKIFNKLKNVTRGDIVLIYSQESIYEYEITSIKKVDKDKALVEFDTNRNMITLSTCDSFGRPQDRYVVEGDFVGIKNL